MFNKFELVFSELAIESYLKISEYIIGNFGLNIFDKFDENVEELIKNIETNKHICPPTKFSINYRKCTINEQCSMIYRIEKETIEIITFVDNRSNHQY